MLTVIGLIIIVFVLIIFFKIIKKPIRLIFKLLLNTLLGFVVLIVFNLLGSVFGFAIPISLISALVVGILGLPGLIILILIQIFL